MLEKTQKIMQLIKTKRGGTFMSIVTQGSANRYLSASAKKGGWLVEKTSKITCRRGVAYSHIKAVKEKGPSETQRQPWGEWVIKNYILKHKVTEAEYLTVAPSNAEKRSKSSYVVTTPEGEVKQCTRKELQALGIMVNSYWNDNEALYLTLPIENIVKIDGQDV